MQLFVRGQLYDFDAMAKIVLCPDTQLDGILSTYEHCWWAMFPQHVPESAVVTQQQIFDAWKRQAHALPPVLSLATLDTISVNMLLAQERGVLIKTAKRALTDIEGQITDLAVNRRQVDKALARIETVKKSLQSLRKGKGKAGVSGRGLAQGAYGLASPKDSGECNAGPWDSEG